MTTAVVVSGCSGSSSTPATPARSGPDLAAFLRTPVATPSSCPPDTNGETVGRRSPWVGHVDVSVFVRPHATTAATTALGARLRALPSVVRVYFESSAQAFEEFRRLYTCSDQVDRSQIPPSYRLVLESVTPEDRDALVRRIYRLPGVASVSCDPSDPCVDVRPVR